MYSTRTVQYSTVHALSCAGVYSMDNYWRGQNRENTRVLSRRCIILYVGNSTTCMIHTCSGVAHSTHSVMLDFSRRRVFALPVLIPCVSLPHRTPARPLPNIPRAAPRPSAHPPVPVRSAARPVAPSPRILLARAAPPRGPPPPRGSPFPPHRA